MKTNRKNIYLMVAFLFLALVLSLQVIGGASANDQSAYIGLVREMEAEKTGLSGPAGVVYSSQANIFHVVESHGNDNNLSDEVVINNISVFGHQVGSTSIKIGSVDPINIVMDNQLGRLFIYQSTTHQLIEVYEDATGNLDPNTFTINDASYFGLQDPQGMTYDPTQGYLYFLDAVGPQLIRIMLQPESSFTDATIDVVNLSWASSMGLHGLAFDPVSGKFYTVSPSEQRLYEFTNSGEMVAFRDLFEFNLSNPQGILFAPSGDQTDNPMESSLYLADSGFPIDPGTDLFSSDNSTTAGTPGKIVELSLVQPLEQINADFSSALIKTTNTSTFSKPSPDPAGLTYIKSRNRLLISDADVEEIKQGITHFTGANLWEVALGGTVDRTANISTVPYSTPSLVPMTNEPTGVTWNPGSGHYYFSDDNALSIYDLDPGIDGLFGTADDSWTSFSTILENGDPEGIAYDTWGDRLFVIDGTNLEVYAYTLSGAFINQFDVGSLGALDTESIEFNPISGSFFILSNLTSRKVFEVNVDSSPVYPNLWTTLLLNTIDISGASPNDPAGLAYAPASNGSGAMRFYIVDRGVDNDIDPNENDGKMYEMTAPVPSTPANTPPSVNAGLDQSILFGALASLSGTATDDGVPSPMTYQWSKVSGPGTVGFSAGTALITTASFSSRGTYVLRLTATDSVFSSYDDINIYVTNVAGSSLLEVRVVTSSDDAEESSTGIVDLVSPDLELVFDASNQTVGMRFTGVNLPKNALISNAYVQFQTDETDATSTSLTIWGEAQDNPGTFFATNLNVSSRLRTATSVGWTPPPWIVVDQAGADQRTSNITTILQEIINRPDWSAGNSMAMIIGGTGRRTARAHDILPSAAPRLHVEYTISTNRVPVAVADTYTTNEDTQLTRNSAQGVLKNDTDADGDPLTAEIYTNPTHGTLTLSPNGSFVYMPTLNFNGTDSFTYYVNDGHFNSNPTTVTINVTPVNDAPVSDNQSATTAEDTAKAVTLTATDLENDPLTWTIVTPPANGTLTGTAPTLTYTPSLNYNGPDSFTFKVRDGTVDSNIATVSITVTPVNDAPVANPQSVSTVEDTAKAITLTATEVDGDALTWTIVTPPAHGALTGTAPALTYTPSLNYNGPDSFTFKVRDGTVDSNTATVTITVTPVNDAPVALNDSYITEEDTDLILAAPGVLGNDTDIENNPLTAILNVGPIHGELTLNTDGSFVYNPDTNYTGTDSFTYHAYDGGLNSNIVTVTINIVDQIERLYLPLINR